MRAHEELRRDTLRFVLAAIRNEEKARLGAAVDKLNAEGKDEPARQAWLAEHRPGDLDDAAVQEVLTKQAKMRRHPIESFRKAERTALAQEEERAPAALPGHLPPQPDA